MSAEILRKAAALMRERAEAAKKVGTYTDSPINWSATLGEVLPAERDHYAAQTPAVALAVAGFLGAVAARMEHGSDLKWPNPEDIGWAEQIARAFLGGDQ